MRDIKFRLFDKDKKVTLIFTLTKLISTTFRRSKFKFRGRFTGLKDKNEVEIYEGDIIDFSYDAFVGNFNTFVAKGIVEFEEGAFWVKCLENERLTKDESYLLYTINIDTIEVIGNIYDNPDLLKGE